MTFEQLIKKIGPQNESEWHKHDNGGGWIQNTTYVGDSVFVGELAIVSGNARVYENAHVSGDARVYENAHVSGDARVYGSAHVSGSAQVYGSAWVYGSAQVSGSAQVYGSAHVSGSAWVYGDAWEKSPLFIIGSRFSATNCKRGHIQIGCECHTFDWWLNNGVMLAKRNNFTDAEIEEYRAIVELFVKIGK